MSRNIIQMRYKNTNAPSHKQESCLEVDEMSSKQLPIQLNKINQLTIRTTTAHQSQWKNC